MVHSKKRFSPERVEGKFSDVRARPRVVASCSPMAKLIGLSKCSERRKVSEVDENRAVVRRWIETFNNPYTPQTEVGDLAPGYIAHAPGLPGPLDLEAWSQFTGSF